MVKSISDMVSEKNYIEVAVGIVRDSAGQLLVAKRPDHWLGGGFWEFPGGKVEIDETIECALKRELWEEVGITVDVCSPLINIVYEYPERKIALYAWTVSKFSGQAIGREGQQISWQSPQALNDLTMLPANRAIMIATQLPDIYPVTPDFESIKAFLAKLEAVLLHNPLTLLLFQANHLSKQQYTSYAKEVAAICKNSQTELILTHPELLSIIDTIDSEGIQLSAAQLHQLAQRPLPKNKKVGAVCCNQEEILKAEIINLDFLVLTATNEDASSLIKIANLPSYVAGIFETKDLNQIKSYGAQGMTALAW